MNKYCDISVSIESLKKTLIEMLEEFNDNRMPFLIDRSDSAGGYIVSSVAASYIDQKIYNDYKEFIFGLSNHIMYDMVLEKCDRFYIGESAVIDFNPNDDYICKRRIKYSFAYFHVYEGEYVYPYDESIPVETIRTLLSLILSIMTNKKLDLVEGNRNGK